MLVREFMGTKLVTISPEETLSKALSKMLANEIHQLPVVEGESLRGMIFLKDLVFSAREIGLTKVKRVMRYVPSLKLNDNLVTAARKLMESGVRALPVEEI